jgi:hypothetical protein
VCVCVHAEELQRLYTASESCDSVTEGCDHGDSKGEGSGVGGMREEGVRECPKQGQFNKGGGGDGLEHVSSKLKGVGFQGGPGASSAGIAAQ